MRKYRIILVFMLALMVVSSSVYAEEGALNVKDVVEKAIAKSVDLKMLDKNTESLTRQYHLSLQSSSFADDMLDMDEAYKDLKYKTSRTPDEEAQLAYYQAIMKDNLDTETRYEYLTMKDVMPSSMNYSVYTNKLMSDVTKNNISVSISELYCNLIKSKNLVELQQKLITSMEKNYADAQKKYNLGKISKNDFLVLGNDLKIAKLELNKYQRNYNAILIQMNKSIGEPILKDYKAYALNNLTPNNGMKPYEDYLKRALENRYEILSSSEYMKLKSIAFDVTKSCYSWEKDINFMQAKYELDDATDQYEKAKIDIETEVYSAYKELENKYNSRASSLEQYNIALSNYNYAVKRYQLGQITEKQLSDSNSSLSRANMQRMTTEIDLWLYQLKMEYAVGLGPGIIIR